MASSSSSSGTAYPSHYNRRPSSIAELAHKARTHTLRENQNLKYYLKHAESNRREGIRLAEMGDVEAAFIAFARTASLVLEMLPAHPDYKTSLTEDQRLNLNLNGQEILDNLGQLKSKISDRYEEYRKDHPEVEESHQRALEAQSAYEASQNIRVVEDETKQLAQREALDRASKLSEEVAQMRLTEPLYQARSLPTPAPIQSAMASAKRAAYGGVSMPTPREQDSPTSPGRSSSRARDAVQSARTAAATNAPSYPSASKPSPYSVEYAAMHPNAYMIPTGTPLKSIKDYGRPASFVGPQTMPLESPSKYDGDSTDSETSYPNSGHAHSHSYNHNRAHSSTRGLVSSSACTHNNFCIHQSSSIPLSHVTTSEVAGIRYIGSSIALAHAQESAFNTSSNTLSVTSSTIIISNTSTISSSTSASPTSSARPTSPDQAHRGSSRIRESNNGLPALKTVILPRDSLSRFLIIASVNTSRNKETCGLLLGREVRGKFVVSTLLIPKQHSTSDTCTMDEEELVMQFTEERGLITLGWIHTHPTQSCFMSSVDLHTHCAFQIMLPESFAVVCAPKSNPNFGIFRLTDPPGLGLISSCKAKEAFHPHPDQPIYTDADKGHVQMKDVALEIVDLR
ncbi:hypothetical protein AAF712_014320 [Marasmius tenuissimus]|uniref:MPN domain-containing protein n=1 Tax=Marasmius tenuissimus TaxID=585030 RepID=A0ABR2ZDY0_9AGAR